MKTIAYALTPLLILVILASISCLLSYFILLALGDVIELRKVVSKGTLILLILSIFPLRKYLNLSWQDLGFAPRKLFIRQMGIGLLVGIATLLPVLLTLYALDIHIIDTGRDWTLAKAIKKILISLILALLISFAEEPLFRGILLAGFKKKMSVALAVILSSFYYAALHFLKSKQSIPYQELDITSGFILMLDAFANWLNPAIISALLALWVVGIFLCIIRIEFKQSIGICVGCHAAWVWQIKTSKDFLNLNSESDYLYLVSQYDGVVGPLVTVWLAIAIAGFYLWKSRKTI